MYDSLKWFPKRYHEHTLSVFACRRRSFDFIQFDASPSDYLHSQYMLKERDLYALFKRLFLIERKLLSVSANVNTRGNSHG